jgi:hypothetical protein
MVREIRFARRRRGDKSKNQIFFSRDDGRRLRTIGACEIILLRAIFGAKSIEVVIG